MKHKVKVEPMLSSKGNCIPNQFRILVDDSLYFQSYNTIICKISNNGDVELDKYFWNYSKTTSKYRNQFLNTTTQEIILKIDRGIYKLTDLN